MPSRRLPRLTLVLAVLGALAVGGQAAFSGSPSTYVVQPGDSLWAISQRTHVPVATLAAANGMRVSDLLLIGRHLTIPSGSSQPAAGEEPGEATGGAATGSGAVVTAAGDGALLPAAGTGFCAGFTPTAARWGVLPAGLAASPSRLALRPLFVRWGDAYGVRPALLEALAWQESGWQEGVVSGAGAVGVGQLLPSTTSFASSSLIGVPLSAASTSDNIRMMAAYVAYLSRVAPGTCSTIAAYYEGAGNLRTWGVLAESRQYVADVEYLIPAFS